MNEKESRCTYMWFLSVFELEVNWGQLSVTGGDMLNSAQRADTTTAS